MTGEGTFIAHLLHLEGFWGFVIVDSPSVKKEPEAGHRDAHLRQEASDVPYLIRPQREWTILIYYKSIEPARCSFSSACPSGWSA